MKIVLFGASGNIGRPTTEELLRRGHTVTAVTRAATSTDSAQGPDRDHR